MAYNPSQEEKGKEVTKVSSYLLPKGGLVIIYRVSSLLLNGVYIVTYDDNSTEIPWGCDISVEGALLAAEREWRVFNPEADENPFTEVLKFLQR